MPWSTCHTKGVTISFQDAGPIYLQGGPVTLVLLRFAEYHSDLEDSRVINLPPPPIY